MSYWTQYWFQGFACFVFASTATFSGITGSALMLPWLIMGYALLPVPEITTHQAVAVSLFLETVAVSIGIYHFYGRQLIDFAAVKTLTVFVLPAAILGALVSHMAPARVLQVGYSILMLTAAALLIRKGSQDQEEHPEACADGERKEFTDSRSGETHRFCAHGLGLQRGISGGGAFMEGMISAGTGEVTVPSLMLRSRYPIPVAVATSLVLVAIADLSASLTHFVQFAVREGLMGIPWNVIVWGAPGMAAGAYVGARMQGRVRERLTRRFFAGVYVVISLAFLAYTFLGGNQ